MRTIVVVGGGIAGLSIAHRIRRRDPSVRLTVLERGTRAGGNIRTEVLDGYTCEWGPDGFLDNVPETLALVRDLGLDPRLLPSNASARRRFIFRNGLLHEVPVSPLAFLATRLVSARAKGRIFLEPFARTRPERDETIFEFAARRIGHEAAAAMIDPMVSGIFAGDARSLSLRACFPKMWQLETDHGGLFRALVATRKRRRKEDAVGAPAGHLTSFSGGMHELVDALAGSLGSVLRLSSGANGLLKGRSLSLESDESSPGFRVAAAGVTLEADAVVLTGSASESAALVRPFDSTLASLIGDIPTAPLSVVCLGYDEAAVASDRGPLDGFGFLVPRSEEIRTLGALWETSIYAHRAPTGKALIRAMIGGALDPTAVDLTDEDVVGIVRTDLRRTMGLRVAPEFVRVIRHPRGIPQYNVGHLARLQRIDTLLQVHPGLILAGNSYRGVSINSCIAEAGQVADRALAAADARRARVPELMIR